ncbi:3933_t:CDS:1, partial [Gigaspora rosea]
SGFFGGTTMGGGNGNKSVVHDIMSFENRHLFYLMENIPREINNRNINANNKENSFSTIINEA